MRLPGVLRSTQTTSIFFSKYQSSTTFLVPIDLEDFSYCRPHLRPAPPRLKRVGLQQALLSGLHSATTLDNTLRVLGRLAKLKCANLFDSSPNWLRNLFTLSLRWCMNIMCNYQHDEALDDLLSFNRRFSC